MYLKYLSNQKYNLSRESPFVFDQSDFMKVFITGGELAALKVHYFQLTPANSDKYELCVQLLIEC